MPNKQEYIQKAEQEFYKTYNRYPVIFDHGDGVSLYDMEGEEYLDFGAGIAVMGLGYNDKQYNEAVKAQWGKMIERYLRSSKKLKAVFLLIDIRHEPSANDKQMYQWILYQGYHPIIIAKKMDKLNRSQIPKAVKTVKQGLEAEKDAVVIPFSAQTKQGREEIYDLIDNLLAGEGAQAD